MISFIVIGRNESLYLEKCLKSIINTVKVNQLDDAEIIYVDSNSTDNSVFIAKQNGLKKIFILSTQYNAAIGRNIGALNSDGDILCFIDGDMEIQSDFVNHVVDDNGNLKYDLVAGNLIQRYYNSSGVFQYEELAFRNVDNTFNKPITGGAFFIKKNIYLKIGGMDNRFIRAADPELGLRLAKKGILLTFLPDIFIKHNTLDPKSPSPKDLLSRGFIYGNMLIYRKNLLNKYTYKRMLRHDSSVLILIGSIILSTIFSPYLLLGYLFALLIRVKIKTNNNYINFFIYRLFRDIAVLISSIFCFEKKIETHSIKYHALSC